MDKNIKICEGLLYFISTYLICLMTDYTAFINVLGVVFFIRYHGRLIDKLKDSKARE